jgi:hypothetical protein
MVSCPRPDNAPIHPAATGERNHWQDARSPLGCNGMVIRDHGELPMP